MKEKKGLLFAILLGWCGGYRFYRKQIGLGVLYLFTFGLCGVGWIIDINSALKSCDTESLPKFVKAVFLLPIVTVVLISVCYPSGTDDNLEYSTSDISSLESDNNSDTNVSDEADTSSVDSKDASKKETDKETASNNTISESNSSVVEYDELQQLYLDLDPKMSYNEMLDLVKSTGLYYSEEKYNGSREIQVAFTEGCTKQSYKKESGDYLEIFYEYPDGENSSSDVLDKYIFGTCAYIPSASSLSLISHFYGSYFSYSDVGNYINDLGKTLELDKNMSKKNQLQYYFDNK